MGESPSHSHAHSLRTHVVEGDFVTIYSGTSDKGHSK